MTRKAKKKAEKVERKRLIVYIGRRPFKIDAADKPVMPAEFIDEDHQYSAHIDRLLKRVDFREVKGND